MSIVGFRKQLAAETPEAEKWECSLNITKPKVVVTIATIIYVFVLPIVGFVVTTAVYLALLSFYLGTRKPLKLILFAVLYTAALYGVFVAWLGVRMPAGFLI
jgi:putative tricarboxylic transport membrane protein